MRKFALVVLGLALLAGALTFAAYRFLPGLQSSSVSVASRSVQSAPTASARRPEPGLSGFATFEMALNVANVLVGIIGIWLTMRGIRAERRAETMALRRER